MQSNLSIATFLVFVFLVFMLACEIIHNPCG